MLALLKEGQNKKKIIHFVVHQEITKSSDSVKTQSHPKELPFTGFEPLNDSYHIPFFKSCQKPHDQQYIHD